MLARDCAWNAFVCLLQWPRLLSKLNPFDPLSLARNAQSGWLFAGLACSFQCHPILALSGLLQPENTAANSGFRHSHRRWCVLPSRLAYLPSHFHHHWRVRSLSTGVRAHGASWLAASARTRSLSAATHHFRSVPGHVDLGPSPTPSPRYPLL